MKIRRRSQPHSDPAPGDDDAMSTFGDEPADHSAYDYPTSDVAAMLREAREAHGLTLQDVVAALRIRYAHIEAIEAGEFDRLPGTTYAIGFVRTYATHVGLDANDIVARFKDEIALNKQQTELNFPVTPDERRTPIGLMMLVGLLIVAIAYGGWRYLAEADINLTTLIPELPERFLGDGTDDAAQPEGSTAGVSDAPSETVVGSGADSSDSLPRPVLAESPAQIAARTPDPDVALPPVEVPEPEPLPPVSTPAPVAPPQDVEPAEQTDLADPPASAEPEVAEPSTSVPVPLPPSPPAPTAPDDANDGRVFGAANTDSRIVIRAETDSWVQVQDSNGNTLITRVFRAGDVYRVPDRPGLVMATGNAGGLRVTVDGADVARLGGQGEVRRGIPLTPSSLNSGG